MCSWLGCGSSLLLLLLLLLLVVLLLLLLLLSLLLLLFFAAAEEEEEEEQEEEEEGEEAAAEEEGSTRPYPSLQSESGNLAPACEQNPHASILHTGPPQLPAHTPRYEFYLYGKTKKAPKPNPRYDPNFGK